MKKKEERIQRALGIYPNGWRITPKGRKILFRYIDSDSPVFLDFEDLRGPIYVTLFLLYFRTESHPYKSKQDFLNVIAKNTSITDAEVPAVSKAWNESIGKKYIEEY